MTPVFFVLVDSECMTSSYLTISVKVFDYFDDSNFFASHDIRALNLVHSENIHF